MTRDNTGAVPYNVFTELRVSDEGVSITLFSEWNGETIVEDEVWLTDEQLSDTGTLLSDLSLSVETSEALSEARRDALKGALYGPVSGDVETVSEPESQSENEPAWDLPDVGDVVLDGNPPDWSDDNRLRVIEVTDTPANRYVIGKGPVESFGDTLFNDTVANKNPSEPEDAPVVIANYIGSDSQYAFPVSRLE
jgi:hypothetical protein